MLLNTHNLPFLFRKLNGLVRQKLFNRRAIAIGDDYLAQNNLLNSMGISSPTILDVGANRGQSATKYRNIFPNAKIFCFEPFPDSFEFLRAKMENDSGVNVYQVGISNAKGSSKFFVNYFDETNSLLPRPDSARRYYPLHASPKSTISVDVITLDDFIADNNIGDVHLIKLDIQGAELLALEGAENLLRRGCLSVIYTEIMFVPHYKSGVLFYQLCNFLSKFGYSLFDMYNLRKATNGQLRYGDAIFISSALRNSVVDLSAQEP